MAITGQTITFNSPQNETKINQSLQKQIAFLKSSQLPHGLWTAAGEGNPINLRPEYRQYIWPRDCVHVIRALLLAGEVEAAGRGLEGLLTILDHNQSVLDRIIAEPHHADGEEGHFRRFMPRYRQEDLARVTRENGDGWDNFQNDVPGAILWLFGAAEKSGFGFLKVGRNCRLLEKVVAYLGAIKFWQDQDAGFWEERPEEVRSSSLAVVTSGLQMIAPYIDVPEELTTWGKEALARLLPRETETRQHDSALLYTIDPFGMVDRKMARIILERTEANFLRENGCIRYWNDRYNWTWQGNHAEWPQFLFKLAIGYKLLGEEEKAWDFLTRGLSRQVEGLFPEALCDGEAVNYPLLWPSAEAINAIIIVGEKYREPYSSSLVPQLS